MCCGAGQNWEQFKQGCQVECSSESQGFPSSIQMKYSNEEIKWRNQNMLRNICLLVDFYLSAQRAKDTTNGRNQINITSEFSMTILHKNQKYI